MFESFQSHCASPERGGVLPGRARQRQDRGFLANEELLQRVSHRAARGGQFLVELRRVFHQPVNVVHNFLAFPEVVPAAVNDPTDRMVVSPTSAFSSKRVTLSPFFAAETAVESLEPPAPTATTSIASGMGKHKLQACGLSFRKNYRYRFQ